MAYRNDLDAMQARLANLDAEVAEKTHERDEVARLLAEAQHRERREAVLADLAAGGPERRLRRNGLIALGLVSASVLGVLAYRDFTKRSKTDRAMDRFEEIANEMCACKDKACAERVNDGMVKWSREVSKDFEGEKPSESDMKRATVISKNLTDCMTKLYTLDQQQAAPTAERLRD